MRRNRFHFIFLVLLLLTLREVTAAPLPEFYRGIRAMGMGNAFTAIVDDHDAVFYNPAGLAFQSAIEFELLNPRLEATEDAIKSRSIIQDSSSNLTLATISQFFGKNVGANASVFPALYLPNFVIGYFLRTEFHMIARNRALPYVELLTLLEGGPITGFGFETRGFSRSHYLRLGIAGKAISRQGYDGLIPLADIAAADKNYIRNLQKGPQVGFGVSLGLQYDIPFTKRDDLTLGTSWLDIGDVNFGGSSSSFPPSIQNNLSAGLAFVHSFSKLPRLGSHLALTAELRHLAQANVDPRLKMHLGTELKFRSFALRGGINQDSLTYGFSLDVAGLQLNAVSYGLQTQSLAFMERERRYALEVRFGLDFGMVHKGKTQRQLDREKYPRRY